MTHFRAYRPQLLCSSVSLKTRSYTVRFTLHSSISVTSSWLRISCALKSSQTRSKKFSPKNKNDLGMTCHIPPLKKATKQGEMPLPSLGPIPLKKNVEFRDVIQYRCWCHDQWPYHLRRKGGGVLIKELQDSHVGRACNDYNGSTMCIYHEQKTSAWQWCSEDTCKRILPLFAYDGCVRGAFRILVNPTPGDSQPLGGIFTNLYLSASSVTVPSWRRGFLSWHVENVSMTSLYVSSEHHCQAEVFCSWYMQIVEPL